MSKPPTPDRARLRVRLGRCLELARQHADLSQSEVAVALGLTRQTLSAWENGTSEPLTLDTLALADLYGVSLAALVGREQLPLPKEDP